MDKVYKFNFIFLRNDSEIKNEFKEMLPANIKEKIRGDIKVSFNESTNKIVSMIDNLVKEKVIEEEGTEMKTILDLSKTHHGKVLVSSIGYTCKAEKLPALALC
jgi:hypothetical protein